MMHILAQHGDKVAEAASAATQLGNHDTWAGHLLFLIVDIGIVAMFVTIMWCLYRVVRGPQLVDRAIASDTLSLQVVGLAVLLTIRVQTLFYFDAVLIMSIMGFASTIAFAQYIARRGRPV